MTKEEIIKQYKEEYFIYKDEKSGYTYEVAKSTGLHYMNDEERAVEVDIEELKEAILNDEFIFAEFFESDAEQVENYDYEAEENAVDVSYLAGNVGVDYESTYERILGYYKKSGGYCGEFTPIMYESEETEREASDEVYYQIWKTKKENEPVKDEYGADVYKGEKYNYTKTGYLFDYVEAV